MIANRVIVDRSRYDDFVDAFVTERAGSRLVTRPRRIPSSAR